jgi:ERCC4-type nuclease
MLIKLDCRESKLLPLITGHLLDQSSITLVSESLPLGDAIICDDDGKELLIIERKSLADLASSIRDGRYKEQGFRLNQCDIHNHHIYYLVEGDLRYYRPFKGMPDKNALLSAMVSISYYKGFSLFRTNTLEETAEWIVHFAQKIEKEGLSVLPYYTGGSEQISETATYTQVVAKRIKKDNITQANIGAIMLSQIPSVSSTAATAIMAKFNTLAALFSALQEDSKCLTSITITNKNGQAKKLTKPCINAVYDFLLGGKPPTTPLGASPLQPPWGQAPYNPLGGKPPTTPLGASPPAM